MYRQQHHHQPSSGSAWNSGRSIGPKRALKPQQVWEIRFHLAVAPNCMVAPSKDYAAYFLPRWKSSGLASANE